ncbi:hypothetical protein ACA910_000215 [Epithemia clementina (nom. ined.)]
MTRFLPITWSLPLLVFVDMLSVSLVLPMLFQYYKQAGVTSANQREMLSSLFNMSQILGGISMGIFKDALGVSSRTLLLVSFVGSALSYGMIAYSSGAAFVGPSSSPWGLWILMASRVLVGFVKQTMTVATTLLTTFISSTTTVIHSDAQEEQQQQQQQQQQQHDRAKYMGRLKASSTMAWIAGPSIGALLYKYIHPQTPALLASALFVVNIALMTILLPTSKAKKKNKMQQKSDNVNASSITTESREEGNGSSLSHSSRPGLADDDEDNNPNTNKKATTSRNNQSFHNTPSSTSSSAHMLSASLQRSMSNLRMAFGSWSLASVVFSRLLFMFAWGTTSYSQLGSFYEDMYQLQSPHVRGYITSYQAFLEFLVQAFLVHPILRVVGGNNNNNNGGSSSSSSSTGDSTLRMTSYSLCFGLTISYFLQSSVPSFLFYLVLISPLSALCMSMMKVSLETLTTQVAPQNAMFSVLAALDILQNIVGVTVPFYRTVLFRFLAKEKEAVVVLVVETNNNNNNEDHALMEGDPDPRSWLVSSGVHWLCVAVIMTLLLSTTTTSGGSIASLSMPHKVKGR